MQMKIKILRVNVVIFIICIDWSWVEFLYHLIEYEHYRWSWFLVRINGVGFIKDFLLHKEWSEECRK